MQLFFDTYHLFEGVSDIVGCRVRQLCNGNESIKFVKWNDGSVEFSDCVKDNRIPSVDSQFRL